MSFLNNLQKSPEENRRKVALVSAAVLTIVIFFVWLSVSRVIGFGAVKTAKVDDSPIRAINTVVGSFGEDVLGVFGSLKERVGSATNEIFGSGVATSTSSSTPDTGGSSTETNPSPLTPKP